MATAPKPRLSPIMPGEILKEEFMDPLGLNVNQLAHSLRVSATRISEIVRGQRTLSPDTALRLSRYFGTTPKFWLNLRCRPQPA